MVPWSSPGDILRWWRNDVLGWSQQQVADRLSVKPTALSNWENGARRISVDITQIDKALEGGGTLAGLLWACGTPHGLDPNQLWTKVFPGEPTPVWLWIRSPSRKLTFAGEWGIARVDHELELGENGLFMTVGMAVATSPLVIHLSEPAWADFGRGELPAEVPGAPVMAAINHAAPSSATGTFIELFYGNLADRFSRSRSRDLAELNRSAPRLLASFFRAFGRSTPPAPRDHAWPPLPAEHEAGDRRLRFARLRRARQLSLVDAARRLAEVTGIEVSKDTLRRFETDVGEPHDRLLPAALDQMLGAAGQLALLEVRADTGSGAVRLPSFWDGPAWFEFDGPDPEVRVTINWGEWVREVAGPVPVRAIMHYSERDTPMRITAGPEVSWRVGIGRQAGAEAINHGWSPASVDVAQRVLSDTEEALLISLERGRHYDAQSPESEAPDSEPGPPESGEGPGSGP